MNHSVFDLAATAFAGLVAQIPEAAWDVPGLGDWDLRALVGHTSRSLITVSTYLRAPTDHEDVTGPAQYYALMRGYAATGVAFTPPDAALHSAAVLAVQIATLTGQGESVLLALTGRHQLAADFSVV